MVGRFVGMALVTIGLLVPTTAQAQGGNPYGAPFGPPNPWLQTNGYQPSPPDGGGPALAPVYAPQTPSYGPTPGGIYSEPNGIMTKIMPRDDDEELPPTPMERFLEAVTRSSTFRLEYMTVLIEHPDDTVLGAETNLSDDPTEPFPVTGGTARVVDLAGMQFRDLDGIRGTIITPLTFADVELSAYVVEQGSDTNTPPELPSTTSFIATPFLVNGAVSSSAVLWDDYFRARYTTDLWGADARLVFDTAPEGEGIKFRPTLGARFSSLREELNQTGIESGVAGIVDTDTSNHLFGAVFGLRTEFEHRFFNIGVEPRASLGVNKYRARVTTDNFASTTEGVIKDELEDTAFSPVLEGVAYARLHLTEQMSLFCSYQIMYTTKVARAGDMTIYNVTNGTSDFRVDNKLNQFTVEGLTIGGEWHF